MECSRRRDLQATRVSPGYLWAEVMWAVTVFIFLLQSVFRLKYDYGHSRTCKYTLMFEFLSLYVLQKLTAACFCCQVIETDHNMVFFFLYNNEQSYYFFHEKYCISIHFYKSKSTK